MLVLKQKAESVMVAITTNLNLSFIGSIKCKDSDAFLDGFMSTAQNQSLTK
jgi:hypothetical protein